MVQGYPPEGASAGAWSLHEVGQELGSSASQWVCTTGGSDKQEPLSQVCLFGHTTQPLERALHQSEAGVEASCFDEESSASIAS